jgi:N-methylhydantoinase A
LNAEHGLADGVTLDVAAAHEAVSRLGESLGLSTVDTALGIVDIANAAMVRAMRAVSVQRGFDVREFTLAAFGGAGPLHAAALAEEVGMSSVIVQPQPGIASALGLLVTDVKHEFSTTWIRPTTDIASEQLEEVFASLQARAAEALRGDSIDVVDVTMQRALDMRYDGQSYQLVVPVGEGGVVDLAHAEQAFHQLHDLTYGYAESSEPTSVVNVRLTAVARINKPAGLSAWPDRGATQDSSLVRRPVTFRGTGAVETPVATRSALRPGWQHQGPVIVEEADSTTVVPQGWTVSVSERYDLMLTRDTDEDDG